MNTPSPRAIVPAMLVIMLAALYLPQAQATALLSRRVSFDVPQQPLPAALLQFSSQSGVEFSAAAGVLAGHRSREVRGVYETQQALTMLLQDTGLTFYPIDDRTVAVRPVAVAAANVSRQESNRSSSAAKRDAEPSDPPGAQIDEVIVTAQRRAERLHDVPASFAVVSDQVMSATGAQDLSDLTGYVPNLFIQTPASLSSRVIIRGVGADSRNIGFDSRVGVYVDGVYLGQSPAIEQGLVDIERVEVLRGPQGALFGKNTVAGAINLVTRRPVHELEAYGSVRLGDYDARQFTGRVNFPVSDTIAAKVSVSKIDRDGFTRNLFDGRDAVDLDKLSYRAQLLIEPSDRWDVLLTVDGLETDELPDFGEPVTDSFGVTSPTLAPEQREVDYDRLAIDERSIKGGAMEANWRLGSDFLLKSITSYRDTDFLTDFDVDYSPLDVFYVNYQDRYKQFVEELHLISPQGQRLEYLLGAYYYRQRATTRRAAIAGSLGNMVGAPPGAVLLNAGSLRTENIALFGNATLKFLERFEAGFGFRLSREEKSFDWSIDGSTIPAFGIATGRLVDSRTDSDFSPTATLAYDVSDQVRLYLRYAEGYKSGGFNLDYVSVDAFPGNLEFDKEIAQNYEAGIKGSAFDRALTFGLAGFVTEYDDFQVNQLRDLGNGRSALIIGNAASVRTRGIELEATFVPYAGLTLVGSYAFLDPKFLEYPGGGAQFSDVSGNQLPYASRRQGSLMIDYRPALQIGQASLVANVSYSYRGGFYTTEDNVRTSTIDIGEIPWGYVQGFDTVDARLGLEGLAGRWDVFLWSRNLLDDDYQVDYTRDFFGTRKEFLGEPRTVGIEVSVEF